MEFTVESSATNFQIETNQPQLTPEVRLGSSKAAVGRNDTEAGADYSVTFGRSYKEGGSWQSTQSFARDHLRWLGKVADRTPPWIFARGLEQDSTAEFTPSHQAEED